MRLALMLSAILLALAGCGHKTRPEPIVQPVEVKIPVAVPCKAAVKRTTARYADQDASAKPDIFEQVRALLLGIRQRDGMEARLVAAVIGCGGTVE